MKSYLVALWAVVLFTGCATVPRLGPTRREPDCITSCGVRARFKEGTPKTSCAELSHAESVAIGLLGTETNYQGKPWDVSGLCKELGNWDLNIGYAGSSFSPAYNANCSLRTVNLATFDWGGLTHEFTHVYQHCGGYQEKHTGAFGGLLDWLAPNPIDHHHLWTEMGVYRARDAALKASTTYARDP